MWDPTLSGRYSPKIDSGVDEIGLSRALAKDQRKQLLKQWRSLRTEIARTDPPPSNLVWSSFDREDQGDDRVTVTVPIVVEWQEASGQGYKSEAYSWTFEVHREDGGWRLAAVKPHPWCGGYIVQSRCR